MTHTKRIHCIRHAKSCWDDPSLDDHDRPLNKRGQRDVVHIVEYFKAHEARVTCVCSSTALRARALAEPLALALDKPLILSDALYTFSFDSLLDACKQLPDHYSAIAVVGHNPAMTRLVNYLGAGEIDNLPTSGVASFDCSMDSWQKLSPSHTKFHRLVTPKLLRKD